MSYSTITRRGFLEGVFASGAVALTPHLTFAEKTSAARILFGACLTQKDVVAKMKAVGFDFCEGGVANIVDPTKNDEWWKKKRDEILSLPLPVRSLSGFIPSKFRLTGPKTTQSKALDYAIKAVRRASEVGVKYIVLGSGGARKVPGKNPSSDDLKKGVVQFTGFCRQLAKRMEGIDNLQIVIEPLRAKETNIVNFVEEGQKIVEAVNSPKIQLLADFYHMMEGKESAESIVRAGSMIKHCHIAEYSTRKYPGNNDAANHHLKQYLQSLKTIGYTGGVSCECGWTKKLDMTVQLEKALKTMKGMI
jgi:sugar phosphate isomerase/epimerase